MIPITFSPVAKLSLVILLILWGVSLDAARGQDSLPEPTQTTQLVEGVTLRKWEPQEPKAQCIQALTIDTNKAHFQVDYTLGGGDPDGSGPFHANGMSVFAAAEHFDFDMAINADELIVSSTNDNVTKRWGRIDVPCMASGQWIVPVPENYSMATLRIDRNGKFQISSSNEYSQGTWHVIRGHYQQLLRGGEVSLEFDSAAESAKNPNPRTAIGLDATGKVITILIVDGQQNHRAVGFTTRELQDWLLALGVSDAINLGGGGNTTFVGRLNSKSPLRVLNTPSDRNIQGFVTLRENVTTLGFKFFEK